MVLEYWAKNYKFITIKAPNFLVNLIYLKLNFEYEIYIRLLLK